MPSPSPAEQIARMIEALQRLGMSPSQIVAETRLSRASVWRYRSGSPKSPSLATYQQLERVCRQAGVELPPPRLR